MIAPIIKLLQTDDWMGISNEIEIAKGKNKIVRSFKDIKKQTKRKWQARHIQ